ncbi:hypothetical protein EV363DRAFT_1406314 [Boletus edulis]|nr:hypothetical protein EV363DRAFT_1406314 [Boletus edulis]
MPPLSWTTPEQGAFLNEWLSKYLPHTEKKDYHHFWPLLFSAWFTKWPEEAVLFPGTAGLLTVEQQAQLGKATNARKHRLQTWFRWRANRSRQGRAQKKKTSVFEEAIEGKNGRILSKEELYGQIHYHDRIKPIIDADREAGKIATRGEFLTASRNYAKHLLDNESEPTKAKVQEMYELQKQQQRQKTKTRRRSKSCDSDPSDVEDVLDADEIQRAIDDLPAGLTRVANIIKRKTGLATSIFCAGPDPLQNWEIVSFS